MLVLFQRARCFCRNGENQRLAFGGNVKVKGDRIEVQPSDSFRKRIYLAPLDLWLTLDAGTFDQSELNVKTHGVLVGLSPAIAYVSQAWLRVEQPAKLPDIGVYHPAREFAVERRAFVIPLKKSGATWVKLAEQAN